jgi:hypothetical protein
MDLILEEKRSLPYHFFGDNFFSSMKLVEELSANSFFYNVFRATRKKTTPLPAAPNRARGIDTLNEFY